MKTLFITVLLMGVVATYSCEKKQQEINELIGRWQLVKSVGGAMGSDVKFPSQLTILHVLDESGYAIDHAQNNFIRMRYTTAPVNDIATGNTATGIVFYDENNQPGTEQFYKISGAELIIKDNVTEPYTHYYKKVE